MASERHHQVAEKRKASEQSYLQNIGSIITYGFSSYLPSGLKKQLPSAQPEEAREKVIGLNFDQYDFEGESRQCLTLTFVNGFQIWDIKDPDNVFELVSKREGAIKCVKFLQVPLDPLRVGRITGKHPVIALASADESSKFPLNAVKLYSLREQDYINTMRFRSEVYDIVCSRRLLVVVLNDHIYGFDGVTMEKLISLPCFPYDPSGVLKGKIPNNSGHETPRQVGGSVIALGARWLAYPGIEVLQNAQEEVAVPGAIDNIVEVAKYLGDVGLKTVSSYMYPEATSLPSSTEKENGAAGTVVIYDVCTNTTVASFRSYRQPIGTIAFDPSGTLLVTASIEGHNFNVYQMSPTTSGQVVCHHIYTLQRGRTNAVITRICFSNDSRWMAASTARGTTHIYAINSEGGPVNVHTHIPSEPMTSFEAPYLMNYTKPKHLALSACARIRQELPPDLDETGRTPCTAASFRPYVGGATPNVKILTITQLGTLSEYDLRPHPPSQLDEDPKKLLVDNEASFCWETCRKSSWPQSLIRLKPRKLANDEESNKDESESRWLANVEICTHTPYYRPLWAGPQFTFKTFQKGAPGSLHSIAQENTVKVRYTLLPARRLSSNNPDFGFNGGGLVVENQPPLPPSASPEREELVKADITTAMATPLDFPQPTTADSYVSPHKLARASPPAVGSYEPSLSPPRERPALSFPEMRPVDQKVKTNDSPMHLQPQPDFGFYDDDDDL